MNSSRSTENTSAKSSSFLSNFQHYLWIFILILSLSFVVVTIIVFCMIKKHARRKKRKIQRRNVIIRKHPESQTADDEDFDVVLLESNNNTHVPKVCFLTDITAGQKKTKSLPFKARYSLGSLKNTSFQTNDPTDDLSDLDLTNIPIRRLRQSKKDLTNISALQRTHQSLNSLSENSSIVVFRPQEKEMEKKKFNPQASTGSQQSEKSCL